MNYFQLKTPGLVTRPVFKEMLMSRVSSSEVQNATQSPWSELNKNHPSHMPWQPRGCNPSILGSSPNVWKSPENP